ncbi:MAG: hypothetical protein D6694_01840, partial [Gammaproteobacteria bacterium]
AKTVVPSARWVNCEGMEESGPGAMSASKLGWAKALEKPINKLVIRQVKRAVSQVGAFFSITGYFGQQCFLPKAPKGQGRGR